MNLNPSYHLKSTWLNTIFYDIHYEIHHIIYSRTRHEISLIKWKKSVIWFRFSNLPFYYKMKIVNCVFRIFNEKNGKNFRLWLSAPMWFELAMPPTTRSAPNHRQLSFTDPSAQRPPPRCLVKYHGWKFILIENFEFLVTANRQVKNINSPLKNDFSPLCYQLVCWGMMFLTTRKSDQEYFMKEHESNWKQSHKDSACISFLSLVS